MTGETTEIRLRPVAPVIGTDARPIRRSGVVLLCGGALALAVLTARGRGRELDHRVFGWANSRLQHPALDAFFRALTELGSLWASVAASGAIASRGRRREAADALAAAGTMWVLGQGMKRAFRRLRPYQAEPPPRLLINKPKGASWPSSHPAVLLAFVTVAGRDLELQGPARLGLAGLAALVACSRVYLGVHYPADVAGGLLLGRMVADVWSRALTPLILH